MPPPCHPEGAQRLKNQSRAARYSECNVTGIDLQVTVGLPVGGQFTGSDARPLHWATVNFLVTASPGRNYNRYATVCYTGRWGNDITRGQLTKIVVGAEGWQVNCPSTPTFVDVPTTHTFFCFIRTAYQHGIISGYSCGTGCLEFRPGNSAVRGQIAKILYNALTQP